MGEEKTVDQRIDELWEKVKNQTVSDGSINLTGLNLGDTFPLFSETPEKSKDKLRAMNSKREELPVNAQNDLDSILGAFFEQEFNKFTSASIEEKIEKIPVLQNIGLSKEIKTHALGVLQGNLGILREKTEAEQAPSLKEVKQSIEAIILCEKCNVIGKKYKELKKQMRPYALGFLQGNLGILREKTDNEQELSHEDVKQSIEAIILCQKCKVRGTDYENFKKQVRDIIKNHPEIGVATGELGKKYDAKAVNNAVNQKNSGKTIYGSLREQLRGTRFRGKATTAVQLQEANEGVERSANSEHKAG